MILKKKTLKKVFVIIITTLLLLSIISMFATKVIYDSVFVRKNEEKYGITEELEYLSKERQEHTFLSGENELQGYLYDGDNDISGLVVLAPGFHATADDYLWQIKELLDYGWAVFAFDTTGSGASEGDSSIGFSQEVFDLQATLDYLSQEDNFGYEHLFLLGHSRGGYAACSVLADDYDIAGVVSVSGINSAMDGVVGVSAKKVGALAYCNYPFLWLYQTMLFGKDVMNLKASEVIGQVDTPVLVVQGKDDEVASTHQYSIYAHRDEITSENVSYYVCDEPKFDGHTSLLFEADGTANDELMDVIHNFFITSLE